MCRYFAEKQNVPSDDRYLTVILQDRAEYRLILSRRGRIPSWLNQAIFRKIEQDNCFIIQHIDNKT
jgi:riboflavin biosynthesis pyrimidine reductase